MPAPGVARRAAHSGSGEFSAKRHHVKEHLGIVLADPAQFVQVGADGAEQVCALEERKGLGAVFGRDDRDRRDGGRIEDGFLEPPHLIQQAKKVFLDLLERDAGLDGGRLGEAPPLGGDGQVEPVAM
ncbi:MAG: hypothetical protein M5U26_19695 [Planctomycetota bacterium]|nr:hypothetical protein [Planctomycetota bacterium]